MPRKKSDKPRKSVWDADYRPYGTTTQRGNPTQWKAAFEQATMGREEAIAVLDQDNAYVILGIPMGADAATIKTAYRRIVMTECKDAFGLNPDAAQVERFKKVHAAYSFLNQ